MPQTTVAAAPSLCVLLVVVLVLLHVTCAVRYPQGPCAECASSAVVLAHRSGGATHGARCSARHAVDEKWDTAATHRNSILPQHETACGQRGKPATYKKAPTTNRCSLFPVAVL